VLLAAGVSHAAQPATKSASHQHPKLRLATSVTFDANHRLWRASANGDYVVVSYSDDEARTFSTPVRVNKEPERIAADGDNRPKIAVAPDGTVYVTYTAHLSQPYAGNIRLSRSTDGGRSFTDPVTVNDNRDRISHRFESLVLAETGRLHIVWIDKRDQAAAGTDYAGAALYYADSADGMQVGANRKVIDHSCECCRIALALDRDDTPVIAWRQIFAANTRDHALQRLDGRSPVIRIAEDNWNIDACPHQGPALAISASGTYHVAWFTNSTTRQGLFYARSADRTTFDEPLAFGNAQAQPAHSALLAVGDDIYLAWKEFDGKQTTVRAMLSTDDGAQWSAPWIVAVATGGSDHPQLVRDGASAFLSWNAQREGYRLLDLNNQQLALSDRKAAP
jgi:hypothetical protein